MKILVLEDGKTPVVAESVAALGAAMEAGAVMEIVDLEQPWRAPVWNRGQSQAVRLR